MLWPKKIHARSLITKKKFLWLENSPPNNFSNGPSLTWCNLKELTTKSAVSTCQRSLACACPVVGYIDHVIHWRVHFSFVLGSVSHFLPLPPPPRLCWFFSTDVFQCDGCLFLSFRVGAHGWVALLCQSWGHYFNLGAGSLDLVSNVVQSLSRTQFIDCKYIKIYLKVF